MVRIPRRQRIIISRTTDLECLSLVHVHSVFLHSRQFWRFRSQKPFKFSGSSLSPKRRLPRETLRLSKIQYILMGFYFRCAIAFLFQTLLKWKCVRWHTVYPTFKWLLNSLGGSRWCKNRIYVKDRKYFHFCLINILLKVTITDYFQKSKINIMKEILLFSLYLFF